MKQKFNNGQISQAEYKTLVSTETQNDNLNERFRGDAISGIGPESANQQSAYLKP